MSARHDHSIGTAGIFAAIGLVQGVMFLITHEMWPEPSGPEAAGVLAPAVGVAISGLCLQLTWAGHASKRWAAVALLTGSMFSALTYWVYAQLDPEGAPFAGDDSRLVSFWPATVVALYAVGPYLQIFVASGELRFPYPGLFFHAWNNALIALFGAAYCLVFSLFVWLTTGLFSMIQIRVIDDITGSPRFWWITLPVLFGLGLATGSENVRVIDSVRGALLAVFRLLLPLFVVIAAVFLLALPFTGLTAIWATGYAAPLLLSTVAVGILFLNADLDDGERSVAYGRARAMVGALTSLVLPAFAVLALHSLYLRIDQHGVTPERFLGVVAGCVMSAYVLAYASGVLLRGRNWAKVARTANIALSAVVFLAAVLLHTPALDPVGWSVRNQVGRLLSGEVDPSEFDFAHLKLERGRLGHAALEELQRLERHPHIAAIREGVAGAFAANEKTRATPFTPTSLRGVAGLSDVPIGLAEAVGGTLDEFERRSCVEGTGCAVFAAPLSSDAEYYCVVAADPEGALCFAANAGAFKFIGTLGLATTEMECPGGCLLAGLASRGPIEATEPFYADVQIAGRKFQLRRDKRRSRLD